MVWTSETETCLNQVQMFTFHNYPKQISLHIHLCIYFFKSNSCSCYTLIAISLLVIYIFSLSLSFFSVSKTCLISKIDACSVDTKILDMSVCLVRLDCYSEHFPQNVYYMFVACRLVTTISHIFCCWRLDWPAGK